MLGEKRWNTPSWSIAPNGHLIGPNLRRFVTALTITLISASSVLAAGCERDEDLVSCIHKCKEAGGKRVAMAVGWDGKAIGCTCQFDMPLDGGR